MLQLSGMLESVTDTFLNIGSEAVVLFQLKRIIYCYCFPATDFYCFHATDFVLVITREIAPPHPHPNVCHCLE